jgi:hypothetical protein
MAAVISGSFLYVPLAVSGKDLNLGITLTTILREFLTQKRDGWGSPYSLSESSKNFSATAKSPATMLGRLPSS